MLIRQSTGFYKKSYIFYVEVFQVSPGTELCRVLRRSTAAWKSSQGFSQHRVQPRFAAQNIDEVTISAAVVISTSVCSGMAAISRRTLWRIAYCCAPHR